MFPLSFKEKITLILLPLLLAVTLWPRTGYSDPPDAPYIKQKMQEVIDFLDSPGYVRAVSWGEHLVLVYALTQERSITPLEFYFLTALRNDIRLTRSAALSVALRGDAPCPTWFQCRAFLSRVSLSQFKVDYRTAELAKQLAAVSHRKILKDLHQMIQEEPKVSRIPKKMPSAVPDIQYNIYFGYLHAHSELSDGEGTAMEAFTYAHDQGNLDFFALTDHGELLCIWPWENKWEQLVNAAEATYQPGTYVTLWGFEWSNPLLGHINVINTADFTGSISHFLLSAIYDWIIDRPEAFGRFNHPGDFDFLHMEFYHLQCYAAAVPQIVGIELWNGLKSFDVYYYQNNWWPFIDYSYWDVGNMRDWYLGALGGQDNHSSDWGMLNDFRVAVLAESLTREAIIDAYQNRRFYATEDNNLYLDLRCHGYPMGTRLSGISREFIVSAWDDSEDTFQEVCLYRNGHLLETKAVSGSVIQVSFSDPDRISADYYYIIVSQNDDQDGNGRNDQAISSPIWLK